MYICKCTVYVHINRYIYILYIYTYRFWILLSRFVVSRLFSSLAYNAVVKFTRVSPVIGHLPTQTLSQNTGFFSNESTTSFFAYQFLSLWQLQLLACQQLVEPTWELNLQNLLKIVDRKKISGHTTCGFYSKPY